MKKSYIVTLCSLAICLVGCGSKATSDNIPIVDLESAIGNHRPFDLSDISTDIDFVVLDDENSEALVGNILNMTESKNVLYVHEGGRPIKLFDRTGKFISTRGVFGRGPNEFLMISNLTVDWNRDNLYLWGISPGKRQIIVYDDAGTILARTDSVSHPAMAMTKAVFRDDKLIMWKQRSPSEPKPIPGTKQTLLDIFSSNLTPAGDVKVSDRNVTPTIFLSNGEYTSFSQGFLSDNGRSILVYETLHDTVFRYNNDMTLSPAYFLNLGKHAPPTEAFGENATMPWSKNFYLVNDILEGDRFIIVRTLSSDGNPGGGISEYLVFDKNDSFRGFIATTTDNNNRELSVGGLIFTPCYIRDNRLVGYIQAIDIVDNAATITNPDLKAIATTLDEDSNPVIVVATLKK